jgi:hypothetical protein
LCEFTYLGVRRRPRNPLFSAPPPFARENVSPQPRPTSRVTSGTPGPQVPPFHGHVTCTLQAPCSKPLVTPPVMEYRSESTLSHPTPPSLARSLLTMSTKCIFVMTLGHVVGMPVGRSERGRKIESLSGTKLHNGGVWTGDCVSSETGA